MTQALSIPTLLANHFPNAEIHWLTKQEMSPLVIGHPSVTKIWTLPKKSTIKHLIQLSLELQKEDFSHIYDAHNNLRSNLVCFMLLPPINLKRIFSPPKFIRRSIKRLKRFLLFSFRINLFEKPFSGQRDLIEPLQKWGIKTELPPPPQIFPEKTAIENAYNLLSGFSNNDYVALAPSAAHFLKRWPKDYWRQLILLHPHQKFILLGGPTDTFLEDIKSVSPGTVLNLAGKSDLATSVALVSNCKALIANDTGLLHVAEQLGKPAIALMGPAPFGFPSRKSTKILELDLPCRPCSKHGQGPCINKNYQQCLSGISPHTVSTALQSIIEESK